MIGQRRMSALLASAALAALALAVSAATASAQTIKIGLINSYSGFLAQAGDEMEKGINLYVKTHEKELPPGVKIEIIRRDDAAAPETGKRVAQELITRDHVQLLVGIVGSPIAAAVAPSPPRQRFRWSSPMRPAPRSRAFRPMSCASRSRSGSRPIRSGNGRRNRTGRPPSPR
jgi:hypothetical protein